MHGHEPFDRLVTIRHRLARDQETDLYGDRRDKKYGDCPASGATRQLETVSPFWGTMILVHRRTFTDLIRPDCDRTNANAKSDKFLDLVFIHKSRRRGPSRCSMIPRQFSHK